MLFFVQIRQLQDFVSFIDDLPIQWPSRKFAPSPWLCKETLWLGKEVKGTLFSTNSPKQSRRIHCWGVLQLHKSIKQFTVINELQLEQQIYEYEGFSDSKKSVFQ